MKKLITALMVLIATPALAGTIVNPGSEEGAFRQVLTMLGDESDKFIQASNPQTASFYMNRDSVLTMWSSEWPGDKSIASPKVTSKNLVALMTYETMMCSREFKSLDEMKDKNVKIATWGSEPVARFLQSVGDFTVVPYGGSGSTTKGYLAGDADTVFTITTKQAAIEADPNTTCFAFSVNGDLGFRFVDAVVVVNPINGEVEKLRNKINQITLNEEWVSKFKGTTTYIGGEWVHMYDEAVVNFSK